MLLARPGTDVHVLELVGARNHDRDTGTLLDATARAAYRRRLTEPELGAHLNRSVVTGTTCRYQPITHLTWAL